MKKIHYKWIIVAASFLALLLVSGIWTTFSVFIKPIQEEFGISRAEISMAASIGLVVSGASLLIFGRIIDKIGPRKVIVYSSILMGASLCLMNLISNFSQYTFLYGVFTALGFAGGGLVANTALVQLWHKENSDLQLSITQSGLPFGTLIITPIATQFIIQQGWRTAYLILGLITLAVIPIVFLMIKDPNMNQKIESVIDKGNTNYKEESDTNLMRLIFFPPFLFLLPVHFICGWTDIALINHLAPHIIDSGFTDLFAAYALSIVGGATWIGTLLFGFLSSKIRRQFLIISIYFLRAATISTLVIRPDSTFLIGFSILFGLTQFSMVPLISSWIGENYKVDVLGRLFALTNVIHSIGAALGTFINGWIFDFTGNYSFAFIISAVISLIASVLYLFVKDNNRK
jgi:predicted MFS family arabinose efflux permease